MRRGRPPAAWPMKLEGRIAFMTLVEIATHCGVSYEAAKKWLHRHGVQHTTPPDVARGIAARYSPGLVCAASAAALRRHKTKQKKT